MKDSILSRKSASIFLIFALMGLSSCTSGSIQKMHGLNNLLRSTSKTYLDISLGNKWLLLLVSNNGKERIELIDLRKRTRVALPGINNSTSKPLSLSVSANAEKVAFIRQRADQIELLIFHRKSGNLRRLDIIPKGIPRHVSIDAKGRVLAVQVGRNGRWDVDIIRI